ncbi:hypothetical protein EUX98_g3018 [Antrodiella citrinella]|uniref:AMP-dependent synthetase/ligase domain-containing protein n=1 Tax=Antrodiella citrinella TaxID=2447956 RepID=A0A4V3XJ05_9APHY|nr:hypothetical protein EUX98_g3018 [Antrodiella citrinella]
MYLKSLYPPVPPTPDVNFHELLWTSPLPIPKTDYILHIDALTGRKRTRNEFYEEYQFTRIHDANTFMFGDWGTLCTSIRILDAVRTTTLPEDSEAFEDIHTFIAVFSDDRGRERTSFGELTQQMRKKSVPRVPVKAVKKDSLAYLVFSSGTSGLPKAVMISHGNLSFTLAALMVWVQQEMKLNPVAKAPAHLVWIAALPFHHSYGLHMFCLRGFIFPTTFVVLPRWDSDRVLAAIPKYRISMLPLVPSVAHQLVYSKKFASADLSTITNVLCGAAALPTALAERLSGLTKNTPISEGYGLTEATLSACLKPTPGVIPGVVPLVGSCGILLPGMEARILREDGSEANVNEPGELWLKGLNVAMGYFNDEKATRETFVNGWLRTGDGIRADANGTLFFVDRLKDTLKISGVQVSPTELEAVLRSHPAGLITDVSVAGVAGRRTADEKVPKAWIVLSDEGKRRGERATIQELDNWVKSSLSSYKWLRGGIEVIDEIPKLPTGKVLRRVLQGRENERRKVTIEERSRL